MSARIRIEPGGAEFAQATGDTVLRAALRAGIGFPYECNSGGCGACRFELQSGRVETLWPEAPGLGERDRRRARHLACQTRALDELSIKLRLGDEYVAPIRPRRRMARLAGCSDITHDLREFRFACDGPAEFRPGQFASVVLPGLESPRAYSMSNLPNAQGQWQFMIRRVAGGRGTGLLFERLREGDEVEIDAPYGLAWLREDSPRDIVCVAGGSGLAPMLSIARAAAARGLLATRHLHFFYGARTPRDACGEAALRELPGWGGAIDYRAVVSNAEGEAWSGETGFVHEAVARALGSRLSGCEIYFAGPPPMTEALQHLLMDRERVPFEQIHFDRFC